MSSNKSDLHKNNEFQIPTNRLIFGRKTPRTIKQQQYRKFYHIEPLLDLEKEFKEAENEPLPLIKYTEDELDKIDDAPSLITTTKCSTPNPPLSIKDDSFDLNLSPVSTISNSILPLATPKNVKSNLTGKIQASIKVDRFATPLYRKTDSTKKVKFLLPNNQDSNYLPSKIIKIKQEQYLIINELGVGGSSHVYHCINIETKIHCAIKSVSLENSSSAIGYINEVKVLEKLQKCERVIKMFDYEILEHNKKLFVVLEVGGMDLSKILKELKNHTVHLPLYKLLFYWMEMLYAVRDIHSNGIIHADLKPSNFIQVEGGLKLIDFGISCCLENDMTSVVKSVSEGSFNYISPEALKNEGSVNFNSPNFGKPMYKLNYKSDIWSLGCILYQFVFKRTPFQHFPQMLAKLMTIVDPNHKIDYPDAKWVPQKIINTIKKCLQYDVKSRPSIDELIEEYENTFNNLY